MTTGKRQRIEKNKLCSSDTAADAINTISRAGTHCTRRRLTGKDASRLLSSSSHLPVKSLSLAKNPIGLPGGAAVLEFLTSKPGMESLDLSGCGIGDTSAFSIMSELTASSAVTLSSLKLQENGIHGPSPILVKFLSKCKALRSLDLSWNR